MGLIGVNLTVPHKILALDCMDDVDTEARQLGAVNHSRFSRRASFEDSTPTATVSSRLSRMVYLSVKRQACP